jgi:hypothetical protein
MPTLGVATKTSRGFPCVEFHDHYGEACTLTASSIVLNYDDAIDRPGTSALWLGVRGVKAQVLARDAARVGIATDATVGWVAYPIPPQVLVTTQMHLSREQAQGLRDRLTQWLETGEFTSVEG